METPITSLNQPFISFNYGKLNIRASSIKYAESIYGNYTLLKFANREQILSSYTLNHYSSILEQLDSFFIVRKGTLINLSFMKSAEKRTNGVFVIMQDGSEFRVSRRKGKEVLNFSKLKTQLKRQSISVQF